MKKITQKSAVLGIDAAWSAKNPSGISLLVQTDSGWNSIGLAPSYKQFIALAEGKVVDWTEKPRGNEPELEMLVGAAQELASPVQVRIITVDMPLSLEKISGRRAADNAVSKAFGAKGCSVHSPNEKSPGLLADRYRTKCHQLGFQLATTRTPVGSQASLIEVYPHTALLELLNLDYRFPYKVTKSWKGATVQERKSNLVKSLNKILKGLKKHIDNISLEIPQAGDVASFASLKRYEDSLDALVCAWVAIAFLEKKCVPYGDEQAAIWVPASKD